MAKQFDMRQFQRRMQVLERQVEGAGRKALRDAAEVVLGEAQQLCPVKTGTLAGSATVDEAASDDRNVQFGFNTDYAAIVHEREDVAHEQGQAKFLQEAIQRTLPRVNDALGKRIKEEGIG